VNARICSASFDQQGREPRPHLADFIERGGIGTQTHRELVPQRFGQQLRQTFIRADAVLRHIVLRDEQIVGRQFERKRRRCG
jgi:hypothetical protein